MGLRYRKGEGHRESDSLWASYSDLFMGLSFIFLLLYVTASLRTGTNQFQSGVQVQKMAQENEELRNQIKIYESMNKEYLETQASADEQKQYEELMAKLDLLKDEANKEKVELEQAAKDHAAKERSLNKYQSMVKSIIQSNQIAKSKIAKRNEVIEEQDVEIETKGTQITQLEQNIQMQERQIQEGQRQIQSAEEQLKKRLAQLRNSYKAQKISEKKMKEQMAKLNAEAEQRIQGIRGEAVKAQQRLGELSQELGVAQKLADQRAQEANSLRGALVGKEQETSQLRGVLAGKEQETSQLRGALAGKEKEASHLKGALEGKEQEASHLKGQLAGKIQETSQLKGQLAGTQAQLAAARAEADARKNIAKQIQQGFAKAGVKATVDANTGDVTIDFGDHFFETGSSRIKPEMAKILHKALPVYARSLMENKTVANKISSLEIVGYASPTYKGKYVDPVSSHPDDKKAIEYNLDLSYHRAKSIFEYVFDYNKMNFEHQKQLKPMVKVSGKSFFESAKQSRSVASGTSAANFCKQYDCKKAQKVLIKFNIDQK